MKQSFINKWAVILTVLFAVLAVGFRGESVGADTQAYVDHYNELGATGVTSVVFEYLYESIASVLAFLNAPVGILFSIVSALGFLAVAVTSNLLHKHFVGIDSAPRLFVSIALFLYLTPFFFAAQVNVIRQGVAMAFVHLFLVGIVCRVHWLWLALLAVIATGFHYTSVFYVAGALFLTLSCQALAWVLLLSFVLYSAGATESILLFASGIFPVNLYEKVMEYGAGHEYKAGVRLDFAVLTIFSGLFLQFLIDFMFKNERKNKLLELIKIYWVLVLPFFFLGFGAYSDRYLLNGWVFISVICGVMFTSTKIVSRLSFWILFLFYIVSLLVFSMRAQGLFKGGY